MSYLNEYLTNQLDATNRIAVYYDEAVYSYEDVIGDGLGVFTIRKAWNQSDINEGEFKDELERLSNRLDYMNAEQRESAVRKYLTITGQDFKIVELQGYSQSEWQTVIVYAKDTSEWLDGAIDGLKTWYRGDVYTLVHEQLITYTAPNGNMLERWESVDSIGSVLAETVDDVMAVALDHFNLETVAC